MPTYAYACADCGHAFDIVQSFSDDALTTCPQCQGRLRKQFNAVGVVFKGGGFYRNDSRSTSASSDSATSSSSSSDSSTGTTASTTSSTAS
ncbi:FmdB family zinc ribbon protein [Janibacter hoylei]|uniref:FmdB family zinc ribbon protein n=1 Tax=Janibacter hoylei TaxID=364298 RepID=UPI0021A496D5|nr:FmdB family zinc ribbon protein [Janibacter hoylei]MCT1619459.1 FmdB family transcriptional regulator [Janibacter hoylei]MCT2292925.1 FmdB family transcriptional regulator [Janibacter hoylei]MCW4602164.1 FmdB family transcriptional regulator [Janibacter hoylei]